MHFPLLRVALVLLSAATPAIALSATNVRLEDLTTVELRDAIGAGTTTILVPIGGTEQNGPHMTLGNALVAPVIAYVPEGGVRH